jgi:hypothetical protein
MAFVDPSNPNLADFTTFVYSQGVPTADLPSNSEYLVWSLGYAQNTAMLPPAQLVQSYVGTTLTASPYVMAVYNLGMHRLLYIAQDVSPSTYFTGLRKEFALLSFRAGPIISSADQATSETMLSLEWMKDMPMQSLDLIKTPWGVFYLQYAQMFGPNLFGVS